MASKGRSAKPLNLGDFNFLGAGDGIGDHEGSVAFSDISFPSHVSDLESFHSDLDISMHSRQSLSADDQAVQQHENDGDKNENFGEPFDLPEQASENVDILMAALKAATIRDSNSDRSSIGDKSETSSISNLSSSRFISKESFPESILADALQSWTKEASQSAEEFQDEQVTAVSYSEKCETSSIKPSSDSRLSEKFLAPSKTPDNNSHTEFGGDKSGRSPWSFSGDSLLFQTPRPAGDTSSLVKNAASSKQSLETKTKPSSSSTLSEVSKNPFDESCNNSLNFQNGLPSKLSPKARTKPSSSSTPVEEGLSNKSKQKPTKISKSSDALTLPQDGKSDLDFSNAVYNPFDGSYIQGSFTEKEFENGKLSLGGDGNEVFGNTFDEEFSFESAGDAAKRLDEDEKIFEESHRFNKEDAVVDADGHSFSYYVLPGETRRSLSVVGINDPNDKGEVRISFGEFFAAKTEELGRLGDGNENRPRPQFSDAGDSKVSPAAIRPRPLYRPSSPEGSEKDASYQPSFTNIEQSQQKTDRIDQSQAEKPTAMATRSSPYGAEADEDKGEGTKEGKGEASKNENIHGDKSKNDTESSKMRSKAPKGSAKPETGRDDSRRSTGGLELNTSTIAALKFCNSSEGSKLSAMTSKELKSLSKTLARANIDDAQEIYKILVNFINKNENAPEEVASNTQRLSEVFESAGGRKESRGQQVGLQEGDPVTFYHSDTSCEVSPTDPKFRTMSSISSPPLDTSSPKGSGSSIGVQTDMHTTEQVSAVPTTLTMVASSKCEGVPVSTAVSTPFLAVSSQSNSGANQTIPPKQYARPTGQTSGSPPPGGLAASPVPPTQYVTITSQATPPGHPNVFAPTSVSRTLTPDPQNNPVSIPSRRSFERTQSLTAVATSSVQAQQHAGDKRNLIHSDPGIVNPLGTAPYRPEVLGYPARGHLPPGIGEPSTIPSFPVETNAVGYQYYQVTGTDQLDPRVGRSVSGTIHSVATLSQTGTTSGHVMPSQPRAICLPQHANTEGSREFLGAPQAIDSQMPVSNHAVPVSSYPPAHDFPRNVCGISDAKHTSHAAFRPVQTSQGIDSIPPPRQASAGFSIPQASGNFLAQSCPAFGDPRLTSSEEYPGFGLRTAQPGGVSVAENTHTISGAYRSRYIAPSTFQEPKPMSAPHSTQKVFNYHNEEFRVVSDVYNQDGTHTRRPCGSTGPLQRQGEVWNSRTERTSQIQMVIPPVLDFPGVHCVGTSAEADLAVYNPTSRWIRCSSEIVTCTVNGLKVDNQECPFSIRGKTMIGPKLTENIKVDFKCLSAGVFVAEMKVISTPVASVSGDGETSSALVSLQGFAEEPKLEIIADELRSLDFGEIHYGCSRVKSLTIANKGMTAVPLKMRICFNSSPGVFIFSKANSPDVIPELELQNTTLKCLVPATNKLGMKADPLVIWVELAGKNNQCFEKADEAQELSAGVNIQLDAGTVAKILGNVQLSAIVGFTKIQIPKAFQMAMCLSSSVGKRVSRELPFTNAGNICANVELTIPKHLDVFIVTPNKFQVRPGMAVMVKVVFTPLAKDTYESVIQVSEPDNNKCYEVLLRGSAVDPQPEMDDGPQILSNKSWLCWTGVELGNATHQRLFLLNDSAEQSIHFQAMILGEHSDFEIQRMRSEFSKGGLLSEQLVLRPKERMPIYVLFAPSSFGACKSALVLKPDRGPRFQIPLYAYGGTSSLSFLDLKKTAEGFDAQLGEVSLGRRNILKITVKNTGHKAAFVKAACYADFQIRLHYHQTHLSIVPSEFVLPERSSKELVIVYQPLQHDAKACQHEQKRVATVVFYHGDEILRQWYRRNATKQQDFDGKRSGSSKNLKYDDIRFDKVFQDENCVAEDLDFPDLENYEQIFDSHISQTFLNLFGGNEKHVIQSGVNEESLVMATPRRRRVEPQTETISGGNETAAAAAGGVDENKDENTVWSLIPEHLSLKVPVQGSSDATKKVQLLNFSDRPLEFELIWPAHCIAVTPHTGTIAPKSQTTINVSAWGSILESGVDLPWSGTAYVKCDGIKKDIAIQIHNPLVNENSPAPSVINRPLSIIKTSKGEPRLLSHTYTAFVRPVKQTQLLRITPTLIDFAEVEVNKASCSTITIENISASSLRWKISSLAPAYAKVSETSSELLRATYPVFSFSTQNGFIRQGQVVKIQVEFRARDAGDYCQIWDCQTNPESPLTSTKVKLELSGKAVVKEKPSAVVQKDKKSVAISTGRESLPELPSKETNEPQKGKSRVYFKSDNVEFPDTEVGQTSAMKIEICNKSTSEHQFRIVTPSAPFYMKCTSLVTKPSHYLRIPVYFSPQEAGKHYEASIKFENIKSGEPLAVKLRAKSI